MKKILALILCLTLILSAFPIYAETNQPSTWAEDGVKAMIEKGLVPQSLQSNYQQYITREEFTQLIVPLVESITNKQLPSSSGGFIDSSAVSINKAFNAKIVGGIGNNKFNPHGLITREQIAIMYVNALSAIETFLPDKTSIVPSYKNANILDFSSVSTWAKGHVTLALNNKVMNGTGTGTFSPKSNATREQAILISYNVLLNLQNDLHVTNVKSEADGKLAKTINEAIELGANNSVVSTTASIEVFFINVGQGDSTIIKSGDKAIIIDAGPDKDASAIINLMKKEGIKTIEYMVATHPHADHIMGFPDLLSDFPVNNILMPEVYHDTASFEDMLTAMSKHKPKTVDNTPGTTFEFGGAQFTVLAPNSATTELNNASVVLKMVHGNNKFLFMGDAEEESENAIMKKFSTAQLDIDVLKVGHHGSSTSSSESFLDTITAKYAIISTGENDYGHPESVTLDNLRERKVTVLRTDLNGTIKFTSTLSSLKYSIEATPVITSSLPPVMTSSLPPVLTKGIFIGNINSHIFHKENCSSLPLEKNRIYFDTRNKAIEEGFKACSKCNP